MKNDLKLVYPAQLDVPRRKSNTEVSGAYEMPQSHGKLFFWEVQLLCFCSKIDLARQDLCQSRLIKILKYKR